jgi:hypothetical protein
MGKACIKHAHMEPRPRNDGLCFYCQKDYRIRYRATHGLTTWARYSNASGTAKRRGIPWLLEYDQWQEITSRRCIYAAKTPSDVHIPVGIDRKDNSVGYTLENSAPCCPRHNEIKSDVFSFEQMLDIVNRYNVPCDYSRRSRKAARQHGQLTTPDPPLL